MKPHLLPLFFLLFSTAAMAQLIPFGQVRILRFIDHDGQIYPFTTPGLRSLTEDLRASDAELYRAIAPDFNYMIKRRNTTLAVGAAAAVLGSLIYFSDPESQGTRPLTARTDAAIIGRGLAIGGIITCLASRPSLKRRLGILNKLNQAKTGEKLRLTLYQEPLPGMLANGLSLRFQF
jgi:hypothetical protein